MDGKWNAAESLADDIAKLAVEAFAMNRNTTLSTLFRAKRTLQGIVDNKGEKPKDKG